MDEPGLEPERHARALVALARVNRVSLASERVWEDVVRLHRRERRPIRVLDVACGGGDVIRRVSQRARRRGVPVEMHGCDINAVALETARGSDGDDAPLRFFELDVRRDGLPSGYDLICSSLFLHHLSREAAVQLLRGMAGATESSILVQDLRRTRLGYLFASAGLLMLTRSDVAKSDGLTSVAGAFTIAEIGEICADAELDGAKIRRCWPQRFAVRWSRG